MRAHNILVEPRTLIGDWDEIAANHGGELKGHTVEVRVLDDGGPNQPTETWWEFRAEVGRITGQRTIPRGHVFTAEDIYESKD